MKKYIWNKVPSITLDRYITKIILKSGNSKIDVEGSEMKVLQGAKESIRAKKIKKILIELNKNNQFFGTSNQKLLRG